MRTVLFYRDFRKFHGGHLKVWDYFSHVLASPEFTPLISFAPRSVWDPANPWWETRDHVADDYDSVRPDVFFIAGRDWLRMDQHPDAGPQIPVVNLVQSVRHADPDSTRHEFLTRRAIRVCVSEAIADAVRETELTNGPVLAIPNSIDTEALRTLEGAKRDIDVLIAGLKQPELGAQLSERLAQPGRRVQLLTELIPREEFVDLMQRARVTLFLPLPTEGFYMPPLEGMALGTLVVCPEHEGEHEIYRPGHNCYRPAYALEDILGATESALGLGAEAAQQMRAGARETAEAHGLEGERQAFLELMHDVDRLWEAPAR